MSESEQELSQAEFDAWVEDLHPDRLIVAIQRACAALGRPAELNSDGSLAVEEDLWDTEELDEAIHFQLVRMNVADIMEELEEEGRIRPDHVDENGHVIYVKTEEDDG